MRYVLLIYGGEPPEGAELEEVLARHRALQAEAGDDVVAVARLNHGDAGVHTVGASEVMDGPYLETKEWLVGFYLVECCDEDEALQRAAQICPTSRYHIEVRPVAWSAP